jgi:hypothetical protein
MERQGDQPLLRAVVQVTLDSPPRFVSRLDDSGAGRDELRLRLRARDRGADQSVNDASRDSISSPDTEDESIRLVYQPVKTGNASRRCRRPTLTIPQTSPSTTIGAPMADASPAARTASATIPRVRRRRRT